MKTQAFSFPLYNKIRTYLKPDISALALCTFLILSASQLQAQTGINLADLNGANGITLTGGGFSGEALAAGDINGDGIDDVIIGASASSPNGNAQSGATYVFFGDSEVNSLNLGFLDGSNGFLINGIEPQDRSGETVASGDINGDGIDDVIIGAWRADPGGEDSAGEIYVVFGGSGVGSSGSIELANLRYIWRQRLR